MKSKIKREKSFIRRIIIAFILFSFLFLVLLFAFTDYGHHQTGPKIDKKLRNLAEEYADTKSDEYDKVDVKKALGKGSYVQIINDDNKVIFSSNGVDKGKLYTDDELDMISNDDEDIDFELIPFTDNNTGERMTLATIYHIKADGTRMKIIIMDQNDNIFYSSIKSADSLVERNKINYLNLNSGVPIKYTMGKSNFKDSSGQEMTLLAFIPITVKSQLAQVYSSYMIYILLFLGTYILLVILFSRWLFKTMKRPLVSLDEAMVKVAEGNVGETVNFRGDKEFNDICNTFDEMSEKLKESSERNERLEKEKKQLISDISHDFKTPLTVIKGYSQALKDGYISEEEREKYLDIIISKTDDLSKLVTELKSYNTLEEVETIYNFKTVDIAEHMRHHLARYYDEFNVNGYELVADIPDESINADVDVRMLDRAIDNLIVNFFKHNKTGKKFYFRIRDSFDKVFITVGDDGAGIPENIRDKVFNPFIMGDESRQNKGSGLGLATVKNVVEKHGGHIELINDRLNGLNTVFIITLKKKKS